jgi:putative hydrolase of the HAD superfamily
MSRQAVVFDLDDTLYRERQFALSGFRAVASAVEARFGLCEEKVFAFLALALRRGRRADAFQGLASRYGLPASYVPVWLDVYRAHAPALRLHASARATLAALRGKWRLGVLTNGLPAVQASKVSALGIEPLVDAVVYADDFGGGKPSPAAFFEVLRRLGVEPRRSVFAGDDPVRDIDGARRVGMRTVLVWRPRRDGEVARTAAADVVVESLAEVPGVAERLVGGESIDVH